MPEIDPHDRLIVGLDVPTLAEAEAMAARLGGAVSFYKIGLQLLFAGGLEDRPVLDASHTLRSEFRCAGLGSLSEIISDQCEEIVDWRVVGRHGIWGCPML